MTLKLFRGRLSDSLPRLAEEAVYTVEFPCADCDPPGAMARLVDEVYSDSDGVSYPVYARTFECHNSGWEASPSPRYVLHDCGDGNPIELGTELGLMLTQMEGCTNGEVSCPTTTLFYDYYAGEWQGSLALAGGTVQIRFYCTFDAPDVFWFLEFSGCSEYPVTLLMSRQCEYPPRWVAGLPQNAAGDCCVTGVSPFSLAYVFGRIAPYFRARLVDVVQGLDVYEASDCCDYCTESPGCCFNVAIDQELLFTIHDIVQTGGDFTCYCEGSTFRLPCQTILLAGCLAPVFFCLTCDFAQSVYDGQAGCQYYRLQAGAALYEPTLCECDPFSLTFEDVFWSIAGGPSGTACSGTLKVTVTHSP